MIFPSKKKKNKPQKSYLRNSMTKPMTVEQIGW